MRTNNTSSLNINNKLTSLHEKNNISDKYTKINKRISDVSNTQTPANITTHNKEKGSVHTHKNPPSYISQTISPEVIHKALLCGETDVLLTIIEKFRTNFFSLSKIEDLLTARNSDGILGLSMALRGGHCEAIRTYERLLVVSGLPQRKISELLLSNINNTTPGLFYALHNGYADAIRAYGSILKYLNLSQEMAIEMLRTNNREGISGLFFAAGKGNIEAMLAYYDICKNINIDPMQMTNTMEEHQRLYFANIINKLSTF
ncbi:hypothetical protein [Escherichia fergusonii]|uniref:hypothetical protein n=1 Tax=Escherichia fergusonii TaxID=564 RepID=UPI001EB83E6F|nr:hypothetical protein [Escherichia fergusonii]EHJ4135844.1 hypothetical protein [Escherichia fergusonii]